ncbi:hypothetical protein RU58_00017 [Achromobacter phage phiAxp-1]|uniref:hypothetical protein n=1 Tax=Achromobacter phage phiAxp-1 TaxID=1610509 RepID=UPI0006552891|nr:hypothetical protein RU58_00017 [Achromobacter phage phiAxp-1]AKJ71406.1 hypothetical protein RU58_00017 [Achromobacter phage phiAxp-1]
MKNVEIQRRECPEFEFEGKTYRHNFTKPGYVYLNGSNEWKDVPKGWTRILRELPYMEDLEIKARQDAKDARTEAQVKPLKVAIVGGEAVIPVATALALRDKLEEMIGRVEIVELPPKYQGYALDVMTFDELPGLGGKYPKVEGSKIAQRFERNTTKGSGRMGGTPDVRKNRRSSIRIAYRVVADVRKRHIGLGYFAKRYPSYWRDAVRVIERAIKGDRFGDWPMKTVKV